MSECAEGSELAQIVQAVVESYKSDRRGHFINRRHLPSRKVMEECIDLYLQLIFPGYFGPQDLRGDNIVYHVGGLLNTLRDKLSAQIEQCICHAAESETQKASPCEEEARRLATLFLAKLPELRGFLIEDVQAAYDGDPAASNLDEVILAYPGLMAVAVYRMAHELHGLGVPLLPRMMTEWAHSKTGADIHPGARIGHSFFIDHATGVVIGETSEIGRGVKLYQGVTLGAISHPRDDQGRVIRNTKRHPTVDDGATLYAHATVLGGTTTVGAESVIGGSVFLTKSVPPRSRVAMKPPELSVRTGGRGEMDWILDFDI